MVSYVSSFDDALLNRAEERLPGVITGFHPHGVAEFHEAGLHCALLQQLNHTPLTDTRGTRAAIRIRHRAGTDDRARAQSLAKPVRDILQQVQATIAAQVTFDPAKSERRFSFAVSDYVIAVLLAGVSQQIKPAAPGIAFEFWPVTGNAPYELENGDVDFIIAPKPYLSVNHPHQELFEEGYACIAWTENTQVRRELALEEYLALAHVEVRLGEKRQPGFAEMMLTRLNYTRKIEVIVPSFDLLPLLVVETDRIATMYRRQAEIYARHFPLQVLPFPLEIPAMVELMQWHRYQDHDPGCLWLRGVLQEAASRLDPIQ